MFIFHFDIIYNFKSFFNIIYNTYFITRIFTRFFLASATVCEFDKQGRINIVNSLIEYAGLKKECTIIGVNDRLEIWSLDKYDNLMKDNLEQLDVISENLFDGDFENEA